MVEGKISDLGHEPCNVQVIFEEYSSNTSFQLWDEDGEFPTVPSDTAPPYEGDEQGGDTGSESSIEETSEVELLRQSVTNLTRERIL